MRPVVICTVVSASLAQGAVVFCQDAPAPAGVLKQDGLTGDWAGARTYAKDKGFELASSLTQFYQGVSSGGTGTSSEYNGTAQALLKLDLGKLAGWEYWSAEVKTKVRFGGPLITSTGTISPVNTAAIIPGPPINPVEPQRGSWSVNYVFRQYLVERAARDGWGLFGQVSFADQATSPVCPTRTQI